MLTLRLCGGVRETSTPSSRIAPSSGRSKPAIIRSVVVLPQPEGPSTVKNSPGRDLEVDAVDDRGVAVALGQAFEPDGARSAHLEPPVSRVASCPSADSEPVRRSPRVISRSIAYASASASSDTASISEASALSAGVGAARACA